MSFAIAVKSVLSLAGGIHTQYARHMVCLLPRLRCRLSEIWFRLRNVTWFGPRQADQSQPCAWMSRAQVSVTPPGSCSSVRASSFLSHCLRGTRLPWYTTLLQTVAVLKVEGCEWNFSFFWSIGQGVLDLSGSAQVTVPLTAVSAALVPSNRKGGALPV